MNWLDKFLGRAPQRRDAAATGAAGGMPSVRASQGDAGGGRLPRFRASGADQLHSVRGDAAGRARIRLRDAFTPAQPIMDHARFAGRNDVLLGLIQSIEDQKLHVVLYGERGVGKTSLLHVFSALATEARYLVHYASCSEASSFDEIFRGVAAQVPLLYHSGYSPVGTDSEGGRHLDDLLPPGPATISQMSDLFARLTGTRLLIILDEFDRSPVGAFRRQVAELIKTLSDRSIRVQLVIAGVASNLTELFEHIPSIRRNILGLHLSPMPKEEVEELIRIGERLGGVRFEPAAIDLITDVASGFPYLASVLAQHAGIAAVERGALDVGFDDVARAIGRVCDEVGDRLSPHSRFAIGRVRAAGVDTLLARLALAGLRSGGRINDEVLVAAAREDDAVEATLERLRGDFRLIERLTDDPAHRFAFSEEGVPAFLWLSFVRERVQADSARTPRGADPVRGRAQE